MIVAREPAVCSVRGDRVLRSLWWRHCMVAKENNPFLRGDLQVPFSCTMSVNVQTRDALKQRGPLNAGKVTHTLKALESTQRLNAKARNLTKDDWKKRRKPHSAGSLTRNHKVNPRKVAHDADYDDHIHSDGEEQDVNFIDVPNNEEKIPSIAWSGASRPTSAASSIVTPRQIHRINAEQILAHSQEPDYSKVYEIDLQAANITEIEKLEKFTKLRVLDLSNNYISKIANFSSNKDIRELKLYGNQIRVIENLDELKELSHLQLQFNRIKSIGKGLSCQRKLKCLRLDNNKLAKLDTRELAGCSNLTTLDFSSNLLDDLSALNCLPNLEELSVAHNRLKSLPDLSRCKRLKELDVSHNQLTDISNLRGLPGLRVLQIHHNLLSDISKVGRLKYLEELFINDNRITTLSAIPLQMPALQILDVSDNHVEDFQQMIHLRGLSDLKELHMLENPCCQEIGSHGSMASEFQLHIPSLEYLNGMQLKRNISRSTTPLMRPMSAASVISTRLVENQMKAIEEDMESYLSSLTEKFATLRTGLDSLPNESPRSKAGGDSRASSAASNSSRPGSRKRNRILEAQQFAAENF